MANELYTVKFFLVKGSGYGPLVRWNETRATTILDVLGQESV
jgi:hypothetical protein